MKWFYYKITNFSRNIFVINQKPKWHNCYFWILFTKVLLWLHCVIYLSCWNTWMNDCKKNTAKQSFPPIDIAKKSQWSWTVKRMLRSYCIIFRISELCHFRQLDFRPIFYFKKTSEDYGCLFVRINLFLN